MQTDPRHTRTHVRIHSNVRCTPTRTRTCEQAEFQVCRRTYSRCACACTCTRTSTVPYMSPDIESGVFFGYLYRLHVHIYVCIYVFVDYMYVYAGTVPCMAPEILSWRLFWQLQIYVYIQIYMYIYIYTYTYMCVHMYVYIYRYIGLHARSVKVVSAHKRENLHL